MKAKVLLLLLLLSAAGYFFYEQTQGRDPLERITALLTTGGLPKANSTPAPVTQAAPLTGTELILSAPPPTPAMAPAHRLLMEAGIDLLPGWARRMHGLSGAGLRTPLVRAGAGGRGALLRWALQAPAAKHVGGAS